MLILWIFIGAAISLPCFSDYKERGRNATANADLRNAATAQEAYYVDHQTYATSTEILVGTTYGLFISEGVKVTVIEADSDSYVMSAFHKEGTKTWRVERIGKSFSFTLDIDKTPHFR